MSFESLKSSNYGWVDSLALLNDPQAERLDWSFDGANDAFLIDQGKVTAVQAFSQEPPPPPPPEPPTDLGEIVVTGSYRRLLGWAAASAGSDGGSSVQEYQPDYTCSEAPDGDAPDARTLDRMRAIAEQIAARINALGASERYEWGSLIYMVGDRMYHTELVSIGRSDAIGFRYSPDYLPDGAHIIGWIHSHPIVRGEGIDQGGLSPEDDRAPRTFREEAARDGGRFSVDSNVMTYVLDQRSKTSGV